MPKGVIPHRNKYQARIWVNGSHIYFTDVLIKIEAAWMRRYAVIIMHDKFAYLQDLPEVEKPSRERRWELMGLVVEKLRQERFLI